VPSDGPEVGQRASLERTFTREDVAAFAALSGDTNPVHLSSDAAVRAGFDRELVHGTLVAGLISRLLGTQLPGPGTIILAQELRYLHPVYVDDPVQAHVEILTVRADKPVLTLRTWVEGSEVALDGTATVVVRRLAPDAVVGR
jgi:acyl dehydratase